MYKAVVRKLFPLLFIIIVVGFSISDYRQQKVVREFGHYTTCTVTNIGGNVICNFIINGHNQTKKRSKPHKYIVDGEKYKVYYYDKLPGKYCISFDEPIFDTLNYIKTSPLRFYIGFYGIRFRYLVNGKEFERFQEVRKDVKKQMKKADIRFFEVFYNKQNPSISYIVLSSQAYIKK